MYEFKGQTVETLLKKYPPWGLPGQKDTLRRALASFQRTVVVLDDDPTSGCHWLEHRVAERGTGEKASNAVRADELPGADGRSV